MDRPSNKNIFEFINNLQDTEGSASTNVTNVGIEVTRKKPIPNFRIDSNYLKNKESDVSKINVSSTTSFNITEGNAKNVANQNELIDEFCILNSTFTPSKNDAKHATHTHVTVTNKQAGKDNSKNKQTKSMLHRNIFTQIEPVIIKPSNYGAKLKASQAEKTTYCRPVVNRYTQEFVKQTMEKNARLHDLIKRLVIARQAEKHNDSWNNYINELRNKHTHYNSGASNVDTLMTHNETMKLIEDYNKIRLNTNLLEHNYNDSIVYSDSNANQNQVIINNSPKNNNTYKYQNNSYCYPTSSQARLSMLSQDRRGSPLSDQRQSIRPIDKRLTDTVVLDTMLRKISDGSPKNFCKCDEGLTLKSNKVQTDPVNINNLNNPSNSNDNSVRDSSDKEFEGRKSKDSKHSIDVDKIRGRVIRDLRSHSKQTSLATIEYKVDTLIKSINTFITEIKVKNAYDKCHKSVAVSISIENIHKNTKNKNDDTDSKPRVSNGNDTSTGLPRKEEILCGLTTANSVYSASPKSSNIDEILIEERNKSDKVKKVIENILTKNDNHCAVQITFDIPTKEGATEVTESFYDTLDTIVEELDSSRSNCRRMTIAVNTDPMGLLDCLLRVSTEAFKHILSYVPNVDYLAYLARLQHTPGIKPANELPSFECNICGAAFRKPSNLSDHIHQHNLGSSRNCCVCRHEIDATHHRSRLFRCQHCGQLFTRAYCRQLHEQACAKNTGKNREKTPAGLLLLS